MDELFTRFDGVFFEKTRLSLVTVLYREEKASFNALKARLSLSDGALYTHLEKLIDAGYAAKTREIAGVSLQTVYGLTRHGRGEFLAYLDFVRGLIETKAGSETGTDVDAKTDPKTDPKTDVISEHDKEEE